MDRRPYCIIYAAIIALTNCTSTGQDPWIKIFDGSSTDGWEIRDGIANLRVEQGQLVTEQLDSLNFAYLVYKEELSDYILECDVKLTGPLNSGILIRGISDPELNDGKIHGFQMEIDQTERKWTGGIYEEQGRKWLTPIKGMGVGEEQALNAYKVSHWNHYRIEAIGNTFKVWVNEVPTTHLIDDTTPKGIIGFQIHLIPPGTVTGILKIKNVQVIRQNPGRYSKEISLPAKQVESINSDL